MLFSYDRSPACSDLARVSLPVCSSGSDSSGRQLIETGIEESKRVFFLHHFKVRNAAAIEVQERLTLVAANFIRWATCWLVEQATPRRTP